MSALVLRLGPLSVRLWLGPLAMVLVLAAALAGLALFALGHGGTPTPLPVLLGLFGLGDIRPSPAEALVLDAFRGPRIGLALGCGAMLALAGATMQDLVRNGLADPGLLGVREGAALAILALALATPGLALRWQVLAGLGGGAASGALVMWLARGAGGLRFLLTGLALSWLLASLLAILLALASDAELERALVWLAGDLQSAQWPAVALAAGVLAAGLALLLALAPAQEVEALGPALAIALGVPRRPGAPLRFAIAIALTAAAVAVGGSFGFVGLIAPHLARALPGRGSTRCRLLNTALLGAGLVLAADTLGRLAFGPVEIPAGIVLTGIGGPAMVLILWRRRLHA